MPPSPFANALPDPLRIRPQGVQPGQAAVYEDFGKPQDGLSKGRLSIASRPGSTVSYARTDYVGMYNPSPAPDRGQSRVVLEHQDAVDRFNVGTGA